MFRWCLGHVLVVSGSCFGGVQVVFSRWTCPVSCLVVSRLFCGCVSVSVLVRV